MFERLFGKKRASSQAFSHIALSSSPQRMTKDYHKLTQEGYLQNPIVYRAINMVAHTMASVPWILYDNTHPAPHHPWAELIETPNLKQSREVFLEMLAAYVLLAGNAYVERIGEDGQELHLLRPDRITIHPGPHGIPQGYEYRVGSDRRFIPVDPLTGTSRILHIKTFHPLNDWYGLSPIEAAASAIDQHNAVGAHNLSLLQNGGRLSGALILKGNGSYGLSEEERAAIKEQLESHYQGTPNAGQTLVLEGDMEWREMGLSPKDMDFLEGKHISAREIAQIFGVPPLLLGVPGDATFANYREARLHLWEDTVLPLLNMVISEFNRWFAEGEAGMPQFAYDMDKIAALAFRRDPIWDRLQAAPFLTINEKRQALGYPPIVGGDELVKEEI